MRLHGSDTIAAMSTAIGEGGIGIIRVSGDEAVSVVEKIIAPRSVPLKDRRSHSMFLTTAIDPVDGSQVDEVLVAVMRAPHTYTREDVVEINCHGGIMAVRKTLQLVLAAGARAAEPGEFTKRAFLNGRIDLAQAEAVIDTIQSRTETALKAAVDQLDGGLSKTIKIVSEKVADVLMQVEVAVDFSDEDIETLPEEALLKILRESRADLENLLETAVRGRVIKEGIRTAIIGRPNVGKSSLLNALLRKERAIVTPVPGTTRDVIEETINIRGIPLILRDTAGIRESEDQVEKIGVGLTRQAIQTAELIFCVIDGSQEPSEEDLSLVEEVNEATAVLVINKSDLAQSEKIRNIKLPENFRGTVGLSALTGAGIDRLEEKIEELIFAGEAAPMGNTIVTNARHEQLLAHAVALTGEAISLIESGQPEEIIAMVIQDILNDLGEITGETVGEDILERIFGQFCIGK